MTRWYAEFLSILAGEIVGGGWGAWMTAVGEDSVSAGYARCCYEITEKGRDFLTELEHWDA